MFRTTEDPSSASIVQYFAKITRMVLSYPLTWAWSVLWHNTDHVHVNGPDITILVISAKYCTRLPDDGSSVIRNMLKHFSIFYNFNSIYELYICA